VARSAHDYYAYAKHNGSSANTPHRLELHDTVQYWLYETGTDLSMFIIFDLPKDGGGGSVKAEVTSTGLVGKGSIVTVEDDGGLGSDVQAFNHVTGHGKIDTNWGECCTDGMVISKLPRPPMAAPGDFNPNDFSWCLHYAFEKHTGCDKFVVRSMKKYYEDGGTIGMFGRDLKDTPIDPKDANTLQLCYTQCQCVVNEKLTNPTGRFNSHEIVFGTKGGIDLYRPAEYCSWIFNFKDVSGIGFYWTEMKMADSPGDKVSFFWNKTSKAGSANVVYPKYPDRDWTDRIKAAKTGSSLAPSTFNSVAAPTGVAFVSFESDPKSPALQPGFDLQYIVIPLLSGAVPTNILKKGGEAITVNGHHFVDNIKGEPGTLKCRFGEGKAGIVAATRVSATSVRCTAPPATTVRELAPLLYVSNDGGIYCPTVFHYITLAMV